MDSKKTNLKKIGNEKFGEKDYKGAIEEYSKAIMLDPKFKEAYRNRGMAKHELQDYQGAIADYSKAIEIDTEFEDA